ncbi:hypothetical protein [Cryobacterium sp. Y50]|uniref:hypothetical protein n=1 Tax=Cryobacterium sp. Y50 TaxID=2048286 RepID=UPI000CE43A09|nr:hypothetical protein [Cryobacterium sp. Y50]
MHATAPPTRRTWPWIVGAAILIGALIIAGAVYYGSQAGTATPTAEPTTPVASSTPSPSTTPVDAEPTGCLGGEARDAAMVLAAQKAAPQTSSGGVEVAAAFVRWLIQFPYPPTADADEVAATALAADAPTKNLSEFFATNPNLSGGLVADSTEYYLSTIPGVWHIESASNDQVIATIGTALVEEGAMSPQLKGSLTVTVRWEDGEWKFVRTEGTRTTEDLFSIGEPFTNGC